MTYCSMLLLFMLTSACDDKNSNDLSPALGTDQFRATLPTKTPLLRARWGIAPTPRNFPKHTPADVEDMMRQAKELGTVAVFMYQWSHESLVETARQVLVLAKRDNLTPILGLSPTTLDQQRKELDVPKRLTGKRSFADKTLCSEYVKTCRELAQLHPPYLCLATEINFLAFQRIDEYLAFAKLYKQAYQAVKQISPQTKVFVSFQFDFMRVLDNMEPGKISKHAELIDVFRPELDVLAITSYPCDFYESPSNMPINYYAHLKQYRRAAEEVMIMEIGWPSSGSGSAQEQAEFVRRLPFMLSELQPAISVWSLLHDVQLAEFGDNLARTGLLERTGRAKPALGEFRKLSGQQPAPEPQNQDP